MVKGIINAFDHLEFCLVINLTMVGNGAVYMATNNCYLVYLFCYHLKYQVASTSYPEKKLISNTDFSKLTPFTMIANKKMAKLLPLDSAAPLHLRIIFLFMFYDLTGNMLKWMNKKIPNNC